MSDLATKTKALQAAFPLEVVGFKPQTTNREKTKAMIATYIDARAVVSRLDEVFPLAWEDEYEVMEHVEGRLTIECKLTVRMGDLSVTRRDVGESTNTDDGRAASRWKSATSDAFKRAAVKFGIGAYLYGLENTWVEVKEAGRSVRITPAGLKAAEAAYVRAVKALGLTETGERSQGQVEEQEPESEPQKPPQEASEPKLSKGRADAMQREMEKLGIPKKDQLTMAGRILEHEVKSFEDLSEGAALTVWQAAKRAQTAA